MKTIYEPVDTIDSYILAMFAWLLVSWPALVRAQDAGGADSGSGNTGGVEKLDGALPPWTEVFDSILNLDIASIPLWRLGVAGLLLVAGVALRRFLLDRLLKPIHVIVRRTETQHDEKLLASVDRPLGWIVNLVAVYFAILMLALPDPLVRVASLVLQTVGTVMVAWMLNKIVDVVLAVMADFAEETESDIDDYLVPVIGRVVRVGLFALVFIVIVQQWGYDVTSLLAGLGIGGLAFALAAKPTLSNWFGSIMIFTDRPFGIGDWIEIDAGEGFVEEVGLRSTRIRTWEDSLITIPNADIASKSIENLSARRRRRIEANVELVYSTTLEQIHEILERIRTLLAEHEEVDEDGQIVRFTEFGDSALVIYVQCYARVTNRPEYYRVREDIHFQITEAVREAGSSFAFPSRSLYVEQPENLGDGGGE